MLQCTAKTWNHADIVWISTCGTTPSRLLKRLISGTFVTHACATASTDIPLQCGLEQCIKLGSWSQFVCLLFVYQLGPLRAIAYHWERKVGGGGTVGERGRGCR